MHVLYVIFVIKRSCWCLHEFGVEHEREKMQGHHCIPANTARLAPRFWGRPIPRAKIGLPAKPRRHGGWCFNFILHLEPCGFGSGIRLRSQTAPAPRFFEIPTATPLFLPHSDSPSHCTGMGVGNSNPPRTVRDCRGYSPPVFNSIAVPWALGRVAQKGDYFRPGGAPRNGRCSCLSKPMVAPPW